MSESKEYPVFDVGAQTNAQSYKGGFWTGNNIDLTSEIGILYPSPKTDDLYSDTTNIYDIVDMAGYSGNATYDVYALINQGTSGALYARTISTGVFASVDALTENPTGSLVAYNGSLFWGTTTKMGKYDGTTFTDAYQSWQVTQETGLYMPSVVFAGKLFFGNMRYVASLDGASVFDPDALILPADLKIIDMRVWNDQIAILAQRTGSNIGTVVYFWDGSASTYQEVIGVNEAEPMAIFSYLGSLLLFGLNGRIYEYRGISADGLSDFQIIADVPGTPTIKSPACVIMSDGLVLFGVLGVSSNAIGVWAYGRLPVTNNVALFQKYTPKGDWIYNDGVTDYYSVTSLFNLRVDDAVFNPQASGTADTVTSDSAAGDSTWLKVTSKTIGLPAATSEPQISCDDDGTVIAVVTGESSEKIWVSTNSGDTWTERDSDRTWYDVAVDDDGSVIVAVDQDVAGGGAAGYVYVSTDSGATFTSKNTANPKPYSRVACDDDGSVIAAAFQGTGRNTIYVSSDTGANWTQRTVAASGDDDVFDICMTSTGATMYAAVEGTSVARSVRKSTDTGATWADSGPSTVNSDMRCISCSSDGAVVVAGSSDLGAYLSTNSGSSWTQIPVATTRFVKWVSVSEDGTKIILGTNDDTDERGVYYSDDSGTNWAWVGSLTGTTAVAVSGDGSTAFSLLEYQSLWVMTAPGTGTTTDDDTFVVTGSRETDTTSFYLKALDFDFAVSTGNTVTGIAVKVTMKKATGTTAKDVLVKLVKAGSIVGNNNGTDTDRSTTETEYTFGGPADLWGTTWTDAQINATDFGCVLQAKNTAAVMAVEKIEITVYWEPPATLPVQQEYVYAAVQRGNVTGITETMKTGIVSLIEPGFSTANMITAGEDFDLPSNQKLLRSMAIQLAKPLVGGESITLYAIEDNTTAQNLRDISWTEIASWEVGEENDEKWLAEPLIARRYRFKFEITPQSGTPTTAPGLISYRANFQPLKLFSNR